MPIHTEDQLIAGNDAAVFATGTKTAVLSPPAASSPPQTTFAFLYFLCVIGELLWLFLLSDWDVVFLSPHLNKAAVVF